MLAQDLNPRRRRRSDSVNETAKTRVPKATRKIFVRRESLAGMAEASITGAPSSVKPACPAGGGRRARLPSPEVADLEEEASLGFHVPLALDIFEPVPPDPLEGRAVTRVNDRPRDVREGCQEIGRPALVIRVVLGDGPEEEILVDLEGVVAADDRVVVDLDLVRPAGEVTVDEVESEGQLVGRLEGQAGAGLVRVSLVRIVGV